MNKGPLTISFAVFSPAEILPSIQKSLGALVEKKPGLVLSPQFKHDLTVAFTEGIANAVRHAAEIKKRGRVECELKLLPGEIEFRIEDHGRGFDLKKVPTPQFQSLKERGRGIFMMRQLTDSIEYKRGKKKNVLILTRQLIGSDRETRDLDLLYEISDAILQTSDIHSVYDIILDKALEFFRVERASILIFDQKIGKLKIVASRGMTSQLKDHIQVPPGEGIAGYVFQHAKPCLIEDIEKSPSGWQKQKQYKSKSFISAPMILSPMRLGAESIGVINLTDRVDGKSFSKRDLRLLTTIANQATAYLYMAKLLGQARDAEILRRELDIARQIQQSYLPTQPPEIPGLEIAGALETAQSVGGDYYDFIRKDDQSLYVVIADVSGHNVAAALTMANFRSQLRTLLLHENDPGRILTLLNELLFEDLNRNDQFISMILACVRVSDKTIEMANAGHRFPILVQKSKSTLFPPYESGTVLGALKGEAYRSVRLTMNPRDWMILYTDGLTETVNEKGERLGLERVQRIVEDNAGSHATAMIAAIREEEKTFRAGFGVSDDITTVAVRFL